MIRKAWVRDGSPFIVVVPRGGVCFDRAICHHLHNVGFLMRVHLSQVAVCMHNKIASGHVVAHGMEKHTFSVHREDGIHLHGVCWKPEGSINAAMCLIHGFGEHMGRYEHVAAYFCLKGVALVGMDMRGHGLSGGSHAPSIDVAIGDISALLLHITEQFKDIPRILYGHSMGGCLVSNYMLRVQPSTISCVVISSPWFHLCNWPKGVALFLYKQLHKWWPSKIVPSRSAIKLLSHDPAIGRAYKEDSLVLKGIPVSTAFMFENAGQWALAHAQEWNPQVPLLLVHGTGDRLTDATCSKAFADQVKGPRELKLWTGMYHETHNEVDKKDVLAYTSAWLDKVLNATQTQTMHQNGKA